MDSVEEYRSRKLKAHNEVLALIKADPNTIEVKVSDEGCGEIYVRTYEPVKFGELPKVDKIREILAKYNLEVGGALDEWDNRDAYKKAYDAFVAVNPEPKNPENYYSGWVAPDGKSFESHSYYWRVKSKNGGQKFIAEYKAAHEEWKKALAAANIPPMKLPGYHFNTQTLGTNDDIANFYKDCKYWGD